MKSYKVTGNGGSKVVKAVNMTSAVRLVYRDYLKATYGSAWMDSIFQYKRGTFFSKGSGPSEGSWLCDVAILK